MTDSAVPQKDHDKIESADGGLSTSILRILKLLARPELAKWRLVMVIAILLTLGASVLEVVSPLLVGLIVLVQRRLRERDTVSRDPARRV